MFNQWTRDIFNIMYAKIYVKGPLIFTKYKVKFVGAFDGRMKAGNDNVPRPKRI